MQSIADLQKLLEVANADFQRVSLHPQEVKDFALHIREQEDGKWAVYLMERGKKCSRIEFEHFANAGRYFLGSVYAEPDFFISRK